MPDPFYVRNSIPATKKAIEIVPGNHNSKRMQRVILSRRNLNNRLTLILKPWQTRIKYGQERVELLPGKV